MIKNKKKFTFIHLPKHYSDIERLKFYIKDKAHEDAVEQYILMVKSKTSTNTRYSKKDRIIIYEIIETHMKSYSGKFSENRFNMVLNSIDDEIKSYFSMHKMVLDPNNLYCP